jgi:AcrR family transcriptional regulator
MKNTKAHILDTALVLFNTQGLSKVTLRTIANEMGISQGNLCYHFKKRDTIIEALYFKLVSRMDENMAKNETNPIGLDSLFSTSTAIMESFYDYRFIMLDFVQLMRENETIKTHYLELSKLREDQFLMLFSILIDQKTLQKEELPNDYLFLYKRIQILGDFWLSSAETTTKKLNKKMVQDYSTIINQSIFPYLTEMGKKEYLKLSPFEKQ